MPVGCVSEVLIKKRRGEVCPSCGEPLPDDKEVGDCCDNCGEVILIDDSDYTEE